MKHQLTILDAIDGYLDTIILSRSKNTARTYTNAMNAFISCLDEMDIDPEKTPVSHVTEDWITNFADDLKSYAPASERLYLTATTGWYEYLAAEHLAEINLPRLRLLIKRRSRKPGQRLPQFPRDSIEKVLEYASALSSARTEDERERLINLRDRAFLLTLGDTGLRVHEACSLRRGDIDWNEGRALLIGKGDREAVVRFSSRALTALKDYLRARATLDGGSGRPLGTLPIFSRHDRGAGNKVLQISTTTGRAIVKARVTESIGAASSGAITPHSFRHYFVTTVLRGSGGNLKLAQELARHKNIAVTQRYAHLTDDELDRGYHEIFENR
ncbi:MAG: tyrosine-type recombinase/integrase [Anaerolineales bacterium]|nr:tyrosine-type recombinase/integrase [Anaerolineales bacterium]